MGKGGRIACIFVPFALTVVSLVCLVLLELGGWSVGSSELNSLYFFRANFTDLSVSGESSTISTALELAKSEHAIADIYEIHLWNFCTSDYSNGTINSCSARQNNFVFDPIDVWRLNATSSSSSGTSSTESNEIDAALNAVKNDSEQLENELLGESGRKALDAYRTAAKWMFIAFQVSFWTTVATLVVSLLAICSRWGSFLTWLLSVVSTVFTVGAVTTATVLFTVLAGALKTILDPYHVTVSVGVKAIVVGWIAAAASLLATLFWLFSVCCCSGKSNPHHYSNKGGLWNAEPRGRGYYSANRDSLRAEKTGGSGYQRVASPFGGAHEQQYGDNVPLNQYSSPNLAYEPYRHG